MLPILQFMKIYVFMPKNEFYPFTVSCFMNFHHPFMFDNFSPLPPSRPSTGFMWKARVTLRTFNGYWPHFSSTPLLIFKRTEPICSWKFNQLQFVRICFNFNKAIFPFCRSCRGFSEEKMCFKLKSWLWHQQTARCID